MGEEKLVALIQESLVTATRTGAAKPSDFSRVLVDTTVQSKAVAFPTDARLMLRARERLVRLARKTGVFLRQSYERMGKPALIAHQRYAHAKKFKRANRALRTIRAYLGRVCRDPLRAIFAQLLSLAFAAREQRQHQRGRKIYSLHAPPEVECIGKSLPSGLTYGPTMNAFGAAEKSGRSVDLKMELDDLFNRQNKSLLAGATVIPATYLRVTIAR